VSRVARGLAAAAAAGLLLAAPIPAAPASGSTTSGTGREQSPELVLADQTAMVSPAGTVSVAVQADGVPGAAALRLSLHDRARSRSELAGAADGKGLRSVLRTTTVALSILPPAEDGSRTAALALSGEPGPAVDEPGVYPLEVEVLDADGRTVDEVVTEVVVRPAASESAPPLSVAPLALVGTDRDHPPRPAAIQALADALASVPEVTATLAVGPSVLDDLATEGEEGSAEALGSLQGVAADRPVLALPYVATSPDALADAGIAEELPRQLDRGAAVLQAQLGKGPTDATWLAAPDLGAAGLRLLSALGIRTAVVAPGRVERIGSGVLTAAQPFVLAPPRDAGRRAAPDEPVRALLSDTRLTDAVHVDEDPVLLSAHVLGELAMLWFEQPGVERAVVLPLDPTVAPAAVGRLLGALRTPELFRTVGLHDAVAATPVLQDRRGDPLRRTLQPDDGGDIPASTAQGVRSLRETRRSLAGMLGSDGPTLDALDRHLLRATGLGLDNADRRRELALARDAASDVQRAISTPQSVTITLTARTGTVPLTIRNDTGVPVDVVLRFRSPKVELPDGDTRRVTLSQQTTRLDVAVRTRTSGAFPFEVDILSPDGELTLATTRYSVRSTAVSGVGLVLSIGAGLFLIVWWARHWRAARSSKLVEGTSRPD
jgi:hypothetical protein